MKFFNALSTSWLLLMLYLSLGTGESSSNYVKISSYSLGTRKFNHLAIHNANGNVFIGALNRLYKLTPDLKPLANATTITVNKILVINYQGTELISCGSSTENLCEIYEYTRGDQTALLRICPEHLRITKNNKEDFKHLGKTAKNSEEEDISTVAFIDNSYQNERNSSPKLYIAVSYGDSSYDQRGITVRTLKGGRCFETTNPSMPPIFHNDYTQYSYARGVNYVYGFNLGKYNYFLTTQRKNGAEVHQYISKLIRICDDVEYFLRGYIEIPIECKYGNESFNLVQAAHVGKPGSQLQKLLNIGPDDNVLFALFSKSEDMIATSNKPSNHSALCIYSLNTINAQFTKNIQHCFSGKGYRWLKFSWQSPTCQKENVNVSLNFCGSDVNFPLAGDIPITTFPVITFNNTLLTAITSKPDLNHTDVFIGTNTGHLKKVVVSNSVWEDADLVIDEGSPINPNLLFSRKKDYLYIMTERNLTRIEIPIRLKSTSVVQNTLPMTTWRSTSTTSNVHSTTTKKIHRKCKDEDEDHNSSPASNLSFSPLTGTREGGTILTITGKDLGYKSEHIRVAEVACIPLKKECINSISCVIQKLNLVTDHEGPVEVYVSGTVIRSAQNFKFVDPKIMKISPKEGPIYGGTELKIEGEYLNAGSSSEVYVGNSSCTIFSRNSTMIQCITNSSHTEQEAIISVVFDGKFHNLTISSFTYVKDPLRDEHGFNYKPTGIQAGGVKILIRNVSSLPVGLLLHIHDEKRIYNSSCEIHNITTKTWICLSPYFSDIASGSIDVETPRKMSVSVLDNATNREISVPNNHFHEFLLYPNPEFDYFINSSIEYGQDNFVVIVGRNINNACHKTDINVEVGNHSCEIISISSNQVICRLLKFSTSGSEIDPEQNDNILEEHDNIIVSIGDHFKVNVSKQSYLKKPDDSGKKVEIYGPMILILLVVVLIASYIIFISKNTVAKILKKLKKTQQQMTNLELCVASECKEAFAELQISTNTINAFESSAILPFVSYHTYVTNTVFSSINDHSFIVSGKSILIHKEAGLTLFEELIMNKRFLLLFVRTLENERNFSMSDRVLVASMIMITLQKNMEYCTGILEALMTELIGKYIRGQSNPKLLLRKTESVVEKMLSFWFTFLLHRFLKEFAAKPVFNLFNAIKKHVNQGPVDAITSQARYCLSENQLIRQRIDYCPLTIYICISQRTAEILGLESAIDKAPVQVLDCDTISQFKEKSLDAIHRAINGKQSLNPSELNVEWFRDSCSRMILYDDDSSSIIEGEWRQKNTLRHYQVPDNTVLNLISDKEMNCRAPAMIPMIRTKESENKFKYKPISSFRRTRKTSCNESTTALIQGNDPHYKEWHLFKPYNSQDNQEDQMVPEIYLTRLLATKSSLQRFVDELFNTIFTIPNQNGCFPIAIKYMFDFLDDQARQHDISDPEVMHIWKNNALPLRFWVNLIKNPNFLFDIRKSNIVDSCLSVIAQVLMDSCSTSEQHLTKGSATTKLLYAKEVPIYNQLVKRYYADIKNMPKISSKDMKAMLAKESNEYATEFDSNVSVHELFKYALKYKEKLINALKYDEFSKDNLLLLKLERVMEIMSAASNL